MAISITHYVDIISGVGAGTVVPTRDLVARMFTSNNLVPPQSFISFDNATAVGEYFGTDAEEYYRSVFYFSWVSKTITQAGSIQFARWVNEAVAPMIYALDGNNSVYTNWTSVTNGSFILTMGTYTYTLNDLDFSSVMTLADVATIVQDAINLAGSFVLTGTTNGTTTVTLADTSSLSAGMSVRAADIPFGTTIVEVNSGTEITLSQAATGSNADENITFNNALWGNAAVSYDSFSGGFDLVGGVTGTATISVTVGGGGTDITPAGLLGWLPQSINTNGTITPGAIWADGSDVETITETLTTSNQISNNFGSFGFLTNLDLTLDQVEEAAAWNYALNNLYLYSVPVTPANATEWQAALADIGGVGLTISPTLSPLQYPEMCPMMIEAATNYDAINSVQNYSFQIFSGLTPSVTDDTTANAYDALGINYYGQTQTAGTQLEFYQSGVLQGPDTSPIPMGVYVNEIWLKDAATAAIATLLLAQTQVPANTAGNSMIINTLQSVINQALLNGTISVNKTLSTSQQGYITSVTGDPLAWHQVQDIGYWLNCTIVQVSNSDYEAQYILVYSKNDVINFVEGTHILI